MIKKIIQDFYMENDDNRIKADVALDSELVGMKIFDDPLIGVVKANDPIFELYSDKYEIMYHKFIRPSDWLESAKTVVSVFLPYSAEVKAGNGRDLRRPSLEWLHGRYEGQLFINKLTSFVKSELEAQGIECVAPSIDKRLAINIGTKKEGYKIRETKLSNDDFWSSWSERHVAFAAGLGTFSLSKNIITEKGSAGRLTSFITNMQFDATERHYKEVNEYCTFCGKCVQNCPVNAIDYEKGKMHTVCSNYLDWVYKKFEPRYACGKCQVVVPCQDKIPEKCIRL